MREYHSIRKHILRQQVENLFSLQHGAGRSLHSMMSNPGPYSIQTLFHSIVGSTLKCPVFVASEMSGLG